MTDVGSSSHLHDNLMYRIGRKDFINFISAGFDLVKSSHHVKFILKNTDHILVHLNTELEFLEFHATGTVSDQAPCHILRLL